MRFIFNLALVICGSVIFNLDGTSAFADRNVRVRLGQDRMWFNWNAPSAPSVNQLETRGGSAVHLPEGCQFQNGTCLSRLQLNVNRPHCLVYFYDQHMDFTNTADVFTVQPHVFPSDRGEASVLHGYIMSPRGSVAYFGCSALEGLGTSPSNTRMRDLVNGAFGGFMFFY